MSDLDKVIGELVAANRILADQGVVDAFGHISVRHPHDPNLFLLSRSRSPEMVEPEDIMTFRFDGEPADGRTDGAYVERFIHCGAYEANREVMSVVHSHALAVLPFSISDVPMQTVIHTASHMGACIPVWDSQDRFGDTGLLVSNIEQGRDLARTLGESRVALMRGHGFTAVGRSLGEVLKISIYLPQNAQVYLDALRLGGKIKPLTRGEMEIRDSFGPGGRELQRALDYWARKANCSHYLEYKKS
ncbi:MAG: class II aldolase/adducin family protein [Beijerinckiaceae bacterium]|nr:class II aldolase/adducin family protein [Beijerinckiaceae bacterium]